MGLTLQNGVYMARQMLGEQIPEYWYTNDLIYHLNWAAQDMCGEAQSLETIFQTYYPAQTQEVAMPQWVDRILGVAVFSGQLFQLEALDDYADGQFANRFTGIPYNYYSKVGTPYLSPQGIPGGATGDIFPVPILQGVTATDDTTVLGLVPQPASTLHTSIWCTRFHPFCTKPQDVIHVPARYADGWYSYAIARGKEKESMLDEAIYYQAKYDKAKEDLVNQAVRRRLTKSGPTYGGATWPMFTRGSSSIIFIDQNPGIIGG